MGAPLHQRHYRFGYDNATVVDDGGATHAWRGDEDAAITMPVDTPFLLRIAVYEEVGTASNNIANQFQCRKNGGAWQNITTTSTICKAVAVNAFTNGQNIPSRRLTTRGTTDNTQAGCTEDGTSGGGANDIPANGGVETECGLQLVSANLAQGDTVQFRLTVGVELTEDVTPTLTAQLIPHEIPVGVKSLVLAGVAPTVTQYAPSPVVYIAMLRLEAPDQSVAQRARPSADSADGEWLNASSSNVNLYDSLNESTAGGAGDTDYIRSGATPVEDSVKVKLSPMHRPKAGTVTLKIRAKVG